MPVILFHSMRVSHLRRSQKSDSTLNVCFSHSIKTMRQNYRGMTMCTILILRKNPKSFSFILSCTNTNEKIKIVKTMPRFRFCWHFDRRSQECLISKKLWLNFPHVMTSCHQQLLFPETANSVNFHLFDPTKIWSSCSAVKPAFYAQIEV